MVDITETACPVCGKPLTTEDDVVVCPECGAPYHRSCWNQQGRCVYAGQHGTPDQWHPPLSRDDEHTIVCGNCGTVNADTQRYCVKCGHDLQEVFNPGPAEQQPPLDANIFYAQFSPYAGIDPESLFDGFPAMDVATFLGPNSGYYLARFHFMNVQRTHTSWNWAAAIFPVEWLLYRKMYRHFAVVFLIQIILLLPVLAVSFLSLQSLLSAYGNTTDAFQALLMWENYSVSIPHWLIICMNLASSLAFVLRAVMATWANHFYHKYCIRRIAEVKNKYGQDQLLTRCALAKAGGASWWSIVLFYAAVLGLSILATVLILL